MLRQAREDDRDQVLRWRNHRDVRGASLSQHVLAPQEHAAWWARALVDPTRTLLVYERDRPCGVVTFFDHDRRTACAWWGYYLDVDGLEERGELLPAWIAIQREALRHAFADLGLRRLEAEVLASNQAVRRFNRRNRFQEVGSYPKDVGGRIEDVVRVRLDAADIATQHPGRSRPYQPQEVLR